MEKDVKEAKYINTAETPIYSKSKVLYGLDVTKDTIKKENEAILMEGELDVISSFQEGISNVVAIKGSAMTEEHAKLLRRFCERLIFSLDSDFAGDQAARRGIEIAEKMGFDMRVATMPLGKDPDEAAREDPILLKKALKDASPLYDYYLMSATKRYGLEGAFAKKKVSDELLPLLSKIENPIVSGHYVRKLATTLNVPESVVTEGIRKIKKGILPQKETPHEQKEAQQKYTREQRMDMYLLALLLQGTPDVYIADIRRPSGGYYLEHPPVVEIVTYLDTYLTSSGKYIQSEVIARIPQELLAVFDEAILWDIGDVGASDASFHEEWQKTVHLRKKMFIRRAVNSISQQLASGIASHEQEINLQQQLSELTVTLAALEKAE